MKTLNQEGERLFQSCFHKNSFFKKNSLQNEILIDNNHSFNWPQSLIIFFFSNRFESWNKWQMIWILSFLLFCVLLFCYLLLAPFYLEIDSTSNLLRIRFHQLVVAEIKTSDSSLIMELRVAWWKKKFDLLAENIRKEKTVEIKKEMKKKSRKISFSKIKAVIKTFKINKCTVHIDTGSMQTNGILFPVFFWIGKWSRKDININFINENKIILQIENNLARMVRAFIFS